MEPTPNTLAETVAWVVVVLLVLAGIVTGFGRLAYCLGSSLP